MTVASTSTEARVSYQLFQSSSMRLPLSSARPPAIKYTQSKGRAFARKKTMLRFVARVLIARQHGWAGWWLARKRRRGGA